MTSRDYANDGVRPATLPEALAVLKARLSEHMSPAEKRELQEAIDYIQASMTPMEPPIAAAPPSSEPVSPTTKPSGDALPMAVLFHETYERLAPQFGYETRKDTRQFDPKSQNGRLMIAVCAEILKYVSPQPGGDARAVELLRRVIAAHEAIHASNRSCLPLSVKNAVNDYLATLPQPTSKEPK